MGPRFSLVHPAKACWLPWEWRPQAQSTPVTLARVQAVSCTPPPPSLPPPRPSLTAHAQLCLTFYRTLHPSPCSPSAAVPSPCPVICAGSPRQPPTDRTSPATWFSALWPQNSSQNTNVTLSSPIGLRPDSPCSYRTAQMSRSPEGCTDLTFRPHLVPPPFPPGPGPPLKDTVAR